jgi:hypothetical protein
VSNSGMVAAVSVPRGNAVAKCNASGQVQAVAAAMQVATTTALHFLADHPSTAGREYLSPAIRAPLVVPIATILRHLRASAADLLAGREEPPPTLDGLRDLTESSSGVRQLVGYADRGTGLHATKNEPPRFETLQASGQHFVPRPLRTIGELAEAQSAAQEDVQDEAIPGTSQHIDGELEGSALRVDGLGHRPSEGSESLSK